MVAVDEPACSSDFCTIEMVAVQDISPAGLPTFARQEGVDDEALLVQVYTSHAMNSDDLLRQLL